MGPTLYLTVIYSHFPAPLLLFFTSKILCPWKKVNDIISPMKTNKKQPRNALSFLSNERGLVSLSFIKLFFFSDVPLQLHNSVLWFLFLLVQSVRNSPFRTHNFQNFTVFYQCKEVWNVTLQCESIKITATSNKRKRQNIQSTYKIISDIFLESSGKICTMVSKNNDFYPEADYLLQMRDF